MTSPKSIKTVSCPNCAKPVQWTTQFPYRPFCCERCKLIDLGEWASAEKIIPGEPVDLENDLNFDPSLTENQHLIN
jgi:endogenous inhibitor of DNA gyrase (YacG/DUF329 family)